MWAMGINLARRSHQGCFTLLLAGAETFDNEESSLCGTPPNFSVCVSYVPFHPCPLKYTSPETCPVHGAPALLALGHQSISGAPALSSPH